VLFSYFSVFLLSHCELIGLFSISVTKNISMEWLWFNAIESFELPGRQCSLFVNDINYVNVLPI